MSFAKHGRFAATALIAIGLWVGLDGPAALAELRSLNASWLAIAVVFLTAQTALSALRWQITAAQLGMLLSTSNAIKEYYLGQAINQVLPGGMVGDAGRAYRAREDAGLLVAGQSVILERFAGQLGLLALLAVGFASMLLGPTSFTTPPWLISAGWITLISIITVAVLVLLVKTSVLHSRLPIIHWMAPVQRALFSPKVLPQQICLSLGTAACNLAAFAACAAAVGLALPLQPALVLIPLILFSMSLPLTVGGWGLREGTAVALLPLAGASDAQALAGSVAFGLAIVIGSLPASLAALPKRETAPVKS